MQEFKKRPSGLSRLAIRVASTAALVFVAYIAVRGAWDMYQKFTLSASGDEIAQKQLTELTEEQQKVTASLAELDSSRGKEAQIRDRYGVARPGEGEIKIIRDASSSEAGTPASSNFFVRLLRALFVW